ncbi:MAG TPA: HAMP domain-containing sensor histidine kinase [Candidatus Angelobacter sp.]|nr:HAMP domain-containing sensor histidine kinase [Candidatus Angelobacter sp.]
MSSRIRTFGIAVLTTSLAWLVDMLLEERFSESSVSLYLAAVLVSTWYGGLRPGLLSIGIAIGVNLVLFDHPELSLAVGVYGFERLILYSALALLVCGLTAKIRRSQEELRTLNAELEEKVKKRTAALNESNRQLEAFCYTLAHDLRAPLRAIQGFAEILIADHGPELDADARKDTERIRNSAERMGRLILDLLAYTDVSRSDFRRQPVDLDAVCRYVLRIFSDQIDQKDAEVSVELDHQYVLADRIGVERVLMHLTENALKFTKAGRRPHICISSEKIAGKIRVSVQDNGIGIDPKYRERIFGVFERLSPTGNSNSTGIGLAIVKRSVEKMGGTVGVESKAGEGSRFWFELSEAPVQKEPIKAPEMAVHERV